MFCVDIANESEIAVDLTIVNKHSTRNLAISTVSWSCLGGVELGRGLLELKFKYDQFTWFVPFLFGSVFLALGIFYVVMLVRRIGPGGTSTGASSAPL
jgi:hypothetical protein